MLDESEFGSGHLGFEVARRIVSFLFDLSENQERRRVCEDLNHLPLVHLISLGPMGHPKWAKPEHECPHVTVRSLEEKATARGIAPKRFDSKKEGILP